VAESFEDDMKNRESLLAATSASSQGDLRIQLNTYDYYQSTPTVLDRIHPLNHDEYTYYHVPIVRIFGSLTTGNRTIGHIHGVFPYIYVPYDNQDCFKFHLKIENAVVQSLNRNKDNKKDTNKDHDDDKILKYIANVSICKGVPFYGFHVGYRAFYKISLLNPSYSKRVADILRGGDTGRSYDVYESHISIGLQFLSDFNLFGCGWFRVNDLFIRIPVLYDDSKSTEDLVDLLMGFRTIDIERIGNSDLEFDILAQNITNRFELNERELHSNFIEKFQSSPSLSTYIQSTKDLWKDGDFQRKLKNEKPYSPPSTIPRVNTKQEWVEEETNKSMFDYIKNLNLPENNELNFNTFVQPNILLEEISSAFEIVDELFYQPEFDLEREKYDYVKLNENQEPNESEDEGVVLLPVNEDYNEEQEAFFENLEPAEDNWKEQQAIFGDDEVNSGDEEAEAEAEAEAEGEDENENEIGEEEMDDVLDMLAKSKKVTVPDNDNDISDIHLTQQLNAKFHHKRKFTQAFISQRPSLSQNFQLRKLNPASKRFVYDMIPPIDLDFDEVGLPKIQYDDPFYIGKPPSPFIHGTKKFKLESKGLEYLKPADIDGITIRPIFPDSTRHSRKPAIFDGFNRWKYINKPPTYEELQLKVEKISPISQLGIIQNYKFNTQKDLERRPDGLIPLSLLVMELFAPTRGEFKPDPSQDEIKCIFWKFLDGSSVSEGIFIINPKQTIPGTVVEQFDDEFSMIERFCEFAKELDPDILSGYEVHSASWGYLIDRGNSKHDYEIMKALSRVQSKGKNKFGDHWGATHTSGIKITGRHVINIWRHLRELKLQRSNIEYVTFHLLHERIPHFSEKSLTSMYSGRGFLSALSHFARIVDINSRLIEAADLITRAAEEARLIGIEFYDVYYRGSQYKVESLMIRIAKAENFILYSASKKQVRKQKPLECIPLVMEPLSAYYKSPLVVLDFQSLYPSIMIAYNYCYSTLLGRLRNYKAGDFNEIGTTKVKHPPGLLKLLENDVNLSPNGLMFVKSSVRKSLLAKMLEDILDTRIMVKSTMKFLDASMQKLYNNRQLALKLTANVTYGYTSASFSGRMPCSDIADAIVQTGRETLENAIRMIEDNENWGAKVVYGDTDSLFVYLPGKSREDAFDIGNEIARQVTESNPDPVVLKFEKVYHPSVLMAKKRYVGYSYEQLDDSPKFDAKGIETVRRDGHPAQQYIVEKSLRILFETNNMTTLKDFVIGQFNKILYNDVSIQDFCFAKDVKIGYYKNPPPGAIVSMKKMAADSRAEPQYKERVPYVIVRNPGKILRERATSPEDFIKYGHKLDSQYYIEKTLIPPLERVFNLMGVGIRQWYDEMPKRISKHLLMFNTDNCLVCGALTNKKLCHDCKKGELKAVLNLRMKMKSDELRLKKTLEICRQCCDNYMACESFDCPNYFRRVRDMKNLKEKDDIKKQLDW
jgi:DNA polymerase zeta